jgi:hypothetical protein
MIDQLAAAPGATAAQWTTNAGPTGLVIVVGLLAGAMALCVHLALVRPRSRRIDAVRSHVRMIKARPRHSSFVPGAEVLPSCQRVLVSGRADAPMPGRRDAPASTSRDRSPVT